MPIGFDPLDVLTVRLNCFDGHRPEAERARFKVRCLTSRQVKQIERILSAQDVKDDTEWDAKLNEALLVGLVGWENLTDSDGRPVPFSAEAFDEFTPRMKLSIAQSYPAAVYLSEGDRKNFDSHLKPQSSAAASATDASAPAVPTNPIP